MLLSRAHGTSVRLPSYKTAMTSPLAPLTLTNLLVNRKTQIPTIHRVQYSAASASVGGGSSGGGAATAAVDMAALKSLRAQTKAGVMACRDALVLCEGNVEKAREHLLKAQHTRAGTLGQLQGCCLVQLVTRL
jgi:hypothetical protein